MNVEILLRCVAAVIEATDVPIRRLPPIWRRECFALVNGVRGRWGSLLPSAEEYRDVRSDGARKR